MVVVVEVVVIEVVQLIWAGDMVSQDHIERELFKFFVIYYPKTLISFMSLI